MESQFGARLREHRERQGIALATVADKTKIKLSVLEELERGELAHWPVGLFRRAYVRSYAQAIGLDPDATVREVLALFPEPVEPPLEPPAPPRGLRGLVGAFTRRRTVEPPAQPASAPIAPPQPATALEAPAVLPPAPEVTPPVAPAIAAPEIDLLAAARVCTELGRAERASQIEPLLRDATRILGARGLIVWLWDDLASELRPAITHGYSPRMLAHLPALGRDADNVTAAAFRCAQTFAINGTAESSGALAIPLLNPSGCAGVLAIELRQGREEAGSVRAVATFFAAVLAQLFGGTTDASDAATDARSGSVSGELLHVGPLPVEL